MTTDRELANEVIAEGRVILSRLDRDLIRLEAKPDDRALLDEIFRGVHTIKGCAGIASLARLERVAHAGESLLGRLRDGEQRADGPVAAALLAMVDAMRAMLDHLEAWGTDGDDGHDAVVDRLVKLSLGSARRSPAVVAGGLDFRAATRRIATAISVEIAALDRLTGAIVGLSQIHADLLRSPVCDDPTIVAAAERLVAMIGELDAGIARTRMQPIAIAWQKFPRIARDLAIACNKKVRLELEGSDTEVDRAITDAVRDPLLHAVRNAIDHGIESPQERLAAGKPEFGRVVLRAAQTGGRVTIEVSDDGRGLDMIRIRARAIELGLLTGDGIGRLSDRDMTDLVFRPGFSTAPTVTSLSGRGVGMDVVRTNIERIGGTVDVESRAGKGTSVRLHVPLARAVAVAR